MPAADDPGCTSPGNVPEELVHLDVDQGVATITLDSPRNRNALSARLRRELLDRVQTAVGGGDVRILVLTHTGPVFCAGADLKEARKSGGDRGGREFAAVLDRLWHAPQPVVARVAGPARAGGIGLLAACDFAVAADSATFAFTEVRIGVVPAVISAPLRHRVLPHALRRLFLTGETFDARRAHEIGLLSAAVPPADLDSKVRGLVETLLLGAPGAVAATKELMRPPIPAEELEALYDLSAGYFASAEAQEGIRAFAEKRQPKWVPAH